MKSFITENILGLLYPRRCPICEDILTETEHKACSSCMNLLQLIGETSCKKCGKPMDQPETEFCFDCKKRQYHFKQGHACWVYDEWMKHSLASFKYRNKKEFGEFYAEEIVRRYSDYLNSAAPDGLIPVPIHQSKRRQRGYNQAEILADEIGRRINLPVYKNILVRNRKTMPQKMLSDSERLKNLKEAFSVSDAKQITDNKLKRIMLVDDIYTSGSTVEACAIALLKCQIEEVCFMSVCIGRGF